jgi:type III pantothenate kinase
MTPNLLAICIGNTRTRFGAFAGDKLEQSVIVPNANFTAISGEIERLYRPIADSGDAVVMIASTSAPMTGRIVEQVHKRLGAKVIRVEQDMPVPIGKQLDPEAIVGEDRLLNAAAAYDVMRQACVVVDAGTAITVDFVDGTGTFHGGAIAAGVQIMLNGLADGATELPGVEMAAPTEPIGHSTVEAIRSGVFYGVRGMVRELTEHYAEVAGLFPVVIATGGDAELLFKDFELIDRTVPDLTLLGMRLTLLGPTPQKGGQ